MDPFIFVGEDSRESLKKVLPKRVVDIIISKYEGREIYSCRYVVANPGELLDFKCQGCGECCNSTPTPLYVEDIVELYKFNPCLKAAETFRVDFINNKRKNLQGPFLTLRKKDDGRCIYYDKSIGCLVHDYKPLICKLLPIKTSNEEVRDKEALFDVFIHLSECRGLFKEGGKINIEEVIKSNIKRIAGKADLMNDLERITKEKGIIDSSKLDKFEIIEILDELYTNKVNTKLKELKK